MAVTTDIVRTWRNPRSVMRDLLARGTREDRAVAYLFAGCLVTFIAQWPRMSRQAAGFDVVPGTEELGMSELMKTYMAGLIAYAPDYTFFLAPYINSYKRFAKGTFAPTKTVWSVDNRTAGFRLCGDGTKGVRVECRIGGSDLNPYLAQAAMLAAGIKGIETGMELAPPTRGDVYEDANATEIPRSLRAATETLRNSTFLREAMGDDVIDHYARCAEWEQEEFDRVVTDWEIERGFERA